MSLYRLHHVIAVCMNKFIRAAWGGCVKLQTSMSSRVKGGRAKKKPPTATTNAENNISSWIPLASRSRPSSRSRRSAPQRHRSNRIGHQSGCVAVCINLPGLLLQTTSWLTILNFFEKRAISGHVTVDMVRIRGLQQKELNPETQCEGFNLFGGLANIRKLDYSLRSTKAITCIPK